MVLLLPGALGRDQPAAKVPVMQHFQAHDATQWSFEALTKVRARWRVAGESCVLRAGRRVQLGCLCCLDASLLLVTWRALDPPPAPPACWQIPPQRADSLLSLEALRASLLAAELPVRRSMSSAALDLLAEPALKTVALAPAPPPHRALRWVQERTGVAVQPRHLALGLQLVVAYTIGG